MSSAEMVQGRRCALLKPISSCFARCHSVFAVPFCSEDSPTCHRLVAYTKTHLPPVALIIDIRQKLWIKPALVAVDQEHG